MNALRDNCDLIAIAVLLILLAIVVPSDLNVVPALARTGLTPPQPPIVIVDGAQLI